MKGYKCDMCNEWHSGTPANDGHHEWMFADNPIYSMNVQARVILSEADPREGQDLCLACFLACLKMFTAACQDRQKGEPKDD